MRKHLNPEIHAKLNTLCIENDFTSKGHAYFRVIEESVLQVIKFEYERAMSHFDLRFGLFSMFSPLEKQWFTDHGCIPNYSIVNLIGLQSPVVLCKTGDFIEFEVLSPNQQLDILEKTGFSWLDDIRTQEQLIRALCEIDTRTTGAIRWNDFHRIEPYLMTSNENSADEIITNIFQQRVGPKAWTTGSWTESDFLKYKQMGFDVMLMPGLDTSLIQIHDWIKEDNQSEIERYLKANWLLNCQYAKFLM